MRTCNPEAPRRLAPPLAAAAASVAGEAGCVARSHQRLQPYYYHSTSLQSPYLHLLTSVMMTLLYLLTQLYLIYFQNLFNESE